MNHKFFNPTVLALSVFVSIAIHWLLYFSLVTLDIESLASKKSQPVKVSIRELKKPEVEPPPPVPEKLSPPPRKDRKLPETRRPKSQPKKNAQKVQGLTQESVIADSSVSAPLGNSLMESDKGKRLTPDEIDALERDLSSDAVLIQGSFIAPEYTPAALDAFVEGRYVVDVFVDAQGDVLDAELRKKIGYGMDNQVIASAKSARFVPRRDAQGVPLAGWTEIAFYLEIP